MADKNVVQFTGGKVPAALAQLAGDNDDLSSGVRGGYSVLSIRGSRWHIKSNGEEQTIMDPNTGDPVGSLRLLLLKANPHVSKNYYEAGYVEGSSEGPTCFSIDGITPDPSSPKLQSPKCASCPQNVFGSRVTDAGKKAKACSDSRRLAVAPEGNFRNEAYGGPMLLRVPAASLSTLAMYGKKMKQRGFPYNSIMTRVSFDHEVAHPKLEFNALRPLTDEEANELVELINDPDYSAKIETVLARDLELVTVPDPVSEEEPLFEEAPATAKPAAAGLATAPAPKANGSATAKPAATKKTTKAAAKPAAKQQLEAAPSRPVAQPFAQAAEPPQAVEAVQVSDESDDALDDSLKDILSSLDSL